MLKDAKTKRDFILAVFLILLTLFSLSAYSNNIESVFVDIFSHFVVQYAVISFVLSVHFLLKKKRLLSLISLLLFFINIFNFNFSSKVAYASMEDNKIVSIYSANIHKDNRWLSRLIKDINNKRPDIILLLEVRPRHVDKLRYILGKYKYKIIDPKMYKTGIGLIFLSKYPVKSFNITNISESGNGIIRSVLDVKGKQVVYYGVHLPRISMDRSFKFKQRIFIKLASIIAEESLPLIVTGDFNSTPYSPIFKKLIDISKLKYPDYEWNPTWPSFFPPLWIPIDHVLVKHDAQIHELTKGGFIFSDHFPIFAKISLS